jgi:amino acid adenylation domain-containing protein
MLFHSDYAPESGVYHYIIGYRVHLPYEAETFQKAVERMTQRHEMLRTSIDMASFSEPMQLVHRGADLRVVEQDWRGKSEGEQEAALAEFMEGEYRTSFVWEQAPPMRMFVHRLKEDEFQCSFSFHHAIMDGWSEASLITELVQEYEGGLAGESLAVRRLGVSYRDYIALERRAMASQESIAFWKQLLEGHRATPVPLRDWRGEEKTAGQSGAEESGKVLVRVIALQEETQEQLQHLAREMGVPLKTVLLAAHMKAMQVLSGQSDLTTGVTHNGRPEVEGGEQILGLFLNTVPFRLKLESGSWRQLIRETFAAEQRIVPHRRYPMVDLREQMGGEALFNTTFSYVHFHVYKERDGQDGQTLFAGRGGCGRTSLDFLVSFEQSPDTGKLGGTVHCDTGLMSAKALERIASYYGKILAGMREDQIGDVRPVEERNQIDEWNRTEAEIPSGCVHELFEEQVRKRPEAEAVVQDGRELSYGELNRRANRLGHYLRELGVGQNARVAICLERGFEMIVGLLAVLKAGGACVPLDPAYPAQRLNYMLADSALVALLTQESLAGRFNEISPAVPLLDLENASPWSREPATNLERIGTGVTPEHLAYVIYTSGAAGRPTGVMIEHGGLRNLAAAQIKGFAVEPDSRVLQFAPLSSDACVFEGVMALCQGASLYLLPQGEAPAGEALTERLKRDKITHAVLPPAVLASLPKEADLSAVHTLVVAGDIVSRDLASCWAHGRRLISVYGPTEGTVCATMHECNPEESGEPPIGRPIANTRVYILDGHGEPVPAGVVGELYIGGAGIARGYLNRPELTAERFLTDRFVGDVAARMYRTGDLGRWQPDGTIEFVGRNDSQVKIRGFRVELGEIEARLAEHAGLRNAVVMAREDTAGDKHLVAYYTCRESSEWGAGGMGAEELRTHLAASLPEHMIPEAYVRLEKLPLTANGEVDRKALPATEGEAFGSRTYEAPEGKIETTIAGIWADVLKVQRVGRQDDFFELGGHSLPAVQVAVRLRQALGVEVGLMDVFEEPVLRDFARGVESARRSWLPAITGAERVGRVPLSFAQQRLWFLAQMEGVSKAYNVPLGLRLRGRLDKVALKRALDRIVARHESLRTTFAMVEGEPRQRIAPVKESHFHLLELDLRQQKDPQSELDRLVAEEAKADLDLKVGPLIRGRLIRLTDEEHVLLITMHHIVSDGWSMGLLFKELSTLYGAFVRGEEDPLAELAVQYADYAVWQRKWMEGEVLKKQAEYWKKNLEGAPELLELPTDRVRPAQQDYAGGALPVMLNDKLTEGLRELSARHGTTLYMTLLAGWAMLVGRLSGQQDVVIGTPVANRGRVEIENLIGFFVNMLVVRVDMSGRPTVGEMLARVKRQAIAAQQHQDIPFEQVVELVQPVRSLAHSPLFQVMFGLQDAKEDRPQLPGLEIGLLESSPHVVSKFDLTLSLQDSGTRIEGGVEYATALFEPSTVERYLGYFTKLLEGMVAGGEGQAVDELVMLEDAERRQVVHEWNRTETEDQGAGCLDEMFEEQVEKTPEAVAVEFGERTLSYAELNAQANRLAHYLRGLGVKPDTRVAVCMESGLEMIVASLGVLKAGGACVALDPQYPEEQLRYMLEDSAPLALLSQRHLQELFAGIKPSLQLVDLSADCPWKEYSSRNPTHTLNGLLASRLAYVMYPGGKGKGVGIEHRNAANLIGRAQQWFGSEALKRTLVSTALNLELAGYEYLVPLTLGATVVIVSSALELLQRDLGVTMIHTGPSVMRALLEANKVPATVRVVNLGAEAVNRRLVERIFATTEVERVCQVYGPAETTRYATWGGMKRGEEFAGQSGRAIGNTRVYVLNEEKEPVPVGVVGELYIGGAGVGRGYVNGEELTAERYVADPFVEKNGERMYQTGEMGRWREGGRIELMGGKESQVKIRSHRIEVGEIEEGLEEHAGIGEAVVVAREEAGGEKRLVAYYRVVEGEGTELGAEELRKYLSGKLAEYMVPAGYVRLEKLPRRGNGEVDRKALPAPEGEAYGVRGYEAPEGEIETAVAGIWREVLRVERVGRQDNFFALGGASLLAVQVIARLRQGLGVEVGVDALFAHPVLAAFAEWIVDQQLATFDSDDLANALKQMEEA